ncbi:hypothetical protein SB725_31645, partial [Pseudomonas sp. SIMBA_041]|uniref:hypothetical protein n=1 Tax=Pseudomonas sp. SIMBA_041 TaxID=3085782 RepID=UPI0039797D3D
KLICRFIVMDSFRELCSTTSSAASAMTTETDKSVFPWVTRQFGFFQETKCNTAKNAALFHQRMW